MAKKAVKCAFCEFLVNGWCMKVTDSPDPMLERECEHFSAITNFQCVGNLDQQQLAEFLCSLINSEGCYSLCPGRHLCRENRGKANGLYEWLGRPVER